MLGTVRGSLVERSVIEEEINQGGFQCRKESRHRKLVEYNGQQLVWLSCVWSPQLIPVVLKSDFWPPSVCLALCFTAVGVPTARSSRGFWGLLLDRLQVWCQQWVWSVRLNCTSRRGGAGSGYPGCSSECCVHAGGCWLVKTAVSICFNFCAWTSLVRVRMSTPASRMCSGSVSSVALVLWSCSSPPSAAGMGSAKAQSCCPWPYVSLV